ncbi:MAG: putative Chemotaxis protein CheA modulated with response regulator receiver region (Modular protein) [Candidatus Acidoferrum typicum]|nr:putative Chemotaxis protein CheA modulated with response regulator receiver region (Modular protein) [Candidatus Acidoferrum typicum]
MSMPDREAVEIFLQEASEHLQYLREYVSVLQEVEPRREDLERLYIAAHTLSGTSASYGFPRFSEVAGKLAHVFQYALNATLGNDLHGPLTEFLSDGISVLETDLLEISDTGDESIEDIAGFKERYRFAFPAEPAPLNYGQQRLTEQAIEQHAQEVQEEASTGSYFDALPADDEVPDEILEFFQPEAEEHLQVVSDCLISLEGNNNPEEINRLFRAIHTVKGSAAQVGLKRLGGIAHRVEDLIGRLRDAEIEPSAAVVDLCLASVDVLKKTLHRQWADESEMRAEVDSLLGRIAEFAPSEEQEFDAAQPVAVESSAALEQSAAQAPAMTRKPGKHPVAANAAKSVRIALERLDRMMNTVGELVINRTRMVGRVAELEKLVDTLGFSKERLHGKVSEFQEKYEFNRISSSRSAGAWNPANTPQRLSSAAAGDTWSDFSELEMDRYDDFNILSRSMAEISADVNEVLTQLEGYIGRVEGDIDEFTKLAHHLQDEFTAARMVPIGTLYSRLSRAVRDAATSAGKQVELDLTGSETELDNNIIQQISDPLVHLVRNSVAHGIEHVAERRASGKSEAGKVSLRAYHRGNHIYIEVEDDGGGIDYDRVKASAIERGLVSPETADRLTDRDFREMLFHPGFSTAPAKTELAGRGVGLDVVRANLNALNGEIDIQSTRGQGTKFTLKVPLTLIISPALFVRCGGTSFALPLAVVEEIRRLRADEIEDVGGKLLTKVRDVVTEVIRLDSYLGLPPLEPINGYFRMVVANAGNRQIGLVVEEVIGKDEIVIKNLGEYLRRVKLFPGTTIAPDGSLILLIDLNRMVASEPNERRTLQASATAARIFAPGSTAVARGTIPAEAIDRVEHERVIVVADDSISVRKFVGRMLEKNGYRVKLAADGLEAAELVAQHGCHLVITDLEMPRMTGYELMVQLRQSPTTRRIPVMVVTSRAGAKHRDRAMKEGATAFLTKPVQEDQLLAAVEQLIGTEATRPLVPVA